jgi:hypothetical protein
MQSHYTPWQALGVPGGWGSQILRQSAHEGGNVVSPTHRPPHFCQRLSRPQGHSAAGSIMSIKNYSDTIGNWSRDLAVCSAVPQPLHHQQRASFFTIGTDIILAYETRLLFIVQLLILDYLSLKMEAIGSSEKSVAVDCPTLRRTP